MKKRNIFFTLAAMMLLTGCSEKSDLQGGDDGQVPVVLTAGSGSAQARRAAGDLYTAASGFDGGEQVKVWMYKNQTDGTVSALYNVGAPTAGISALTLSNGETNIYYPTGATGIVTFYGAYPTTSLTSHTVKYNQTNTADGNANYKASDLMYARTDVSWTTGQKQTLRPNLAFQHQLSKLTLTIVKTNEVSKVEGVRMVNTKRRVPVSSITVSGMTLGTPASATGETAVQGGNKNEILLSENGEEASTSDETYTYSCVFVPQEWNDANIIEVDVDGTTAYFSTTKTFEGGKLYGTTLTLRGASLHTTATIGDWVEADLDSDQDIHVLGSSTYAYAATYPTAKEGLVYSGSAQELITAATGVVGGTIKYAVTTTATAPATSSFTTTIPTGTTAGTYYVWYYIASDADHQDTPVRKVVAAISQRQLTDNGVALSESERGYIVAANGKAYEPTDYNKEYLTSANIDIAGMVAYKSDNAGESLVMAAKDMSSRKVWTDICSANETPIPLTDTNLVSIDGYDWIVGISTQYQTALTGTLATSAPTASTEYTQSTINSLLTSAGCDEFLASNGYWSSTEYNSSIAWRFSNNYWGAYSKTVSRDVRPLFVF